MTESQNHQEPGNQETLDAGLFAELHSKEPDFQKVASLLDSGANPNARDEDNVPAFHSMVEWGNIPVIKLALAKGAEVNAKDDYGDTPLHKAITPDTAIELLLAGASTQTYNEEFRTPRNQIGLDDNTANYSNVVSATRLLLMDAETIEKDANRYNVSFETLEKIWPDRAFEYPGPSRPLTHPYALRYLLHKNLESGGNFDKKAVFATSKIGEAMEHLLSTDAENVLAWNRFCDAKGTPMTARDWDMSEVLDKMKPEVMAGLFEPHRFTGPQGLQEIYDIHAALPKQMQTAEPDSTLGTAISRAIHAYINEGEGRTLSSKGISALFNQMPESVKPYFTNFHQEIQLRRQGSQGIGR